MKPLTAAIIAATGVGAVMWWRRGPDELLVVDARQGAPLKIDEPYEHTFVGFDGSGQRVSESKSILVLRSIEVLNRDKVRVRAEYTENGGETQAIEDELPIHYDHPASEGIPLVVIPT